MTDRLAHEVKPDGESTVKWAMREPGFFGSAKRLICCARCGGFLPSGQNTPRKVYGLLTSSMHFLCDECHEALPS